MIDSEKNRIIWQSRRGMLELDLLLEPFARNCFEKLSFEQQQDYREFLSHEDQDLYAWLLDRREPVNASFKPLIRLIMENNASFS